MFCGECGCRVDGRVRIFGVKWVRDRRCGHGMQFLGYIQPPEVLRAKGILKTVGEMEPDPRIERDRMSKEWDKAVERKEIEAFERQQQTHTNQRFHKVTTMPILEA